MTQHKISDGCAEDSLQQQQNMPTSEEKSNVSVVLLGYRWRDYSLQYLAIIYNGHY